MCRETVITITSNDQTEIVIDQCRGNVPIGGIRSAVGKFAPSRGRDIKGTVFAGEAQNQPPGRALPSLILGEWHSPEDHVRAAQQVNPFAELINSALSPEIKEAIYFAGAKPIGTAQRRNNATTTLQ